jgi:hypothetical protein
VSEDKAYNLKVAYNEAMRGGDGLVLEDILTFCHFFEPSDESNPNIALIKNGRRDVAMFILQRMGMTPDDFKRALLGG